jgi:glyoxylase-like metal-dependent hydrolase (beta-lactamase superfamily II)
MACQEIIGMLFNNKNRKPAIQPSRKAEKMALKYRVFQHSYIGFNGTSTLFYGDRDAVLIDACFTLTDAHRLAAGLLEMRKNITHIYISHFHPDHHFGLVVLQYAFPKAKIVALPSVVKDIVFSTDDKIQMWGDMYGDEVPKTVVFPFPLGSNKLQVEGADIEFSDDWDGDSANNTMIWVPSLRTACGTDIVYNDAHVWTVESDPARRNKWRACLKKLKEMKPRVVIPGHCSPEKLNLEDTSGIDFTLKYLDLYDKVYTKAKTGDELVEMVEKVFPGMKAIDYGLHWQARLLFPNACSDRLAKLPGIFRAPGGGIDGETARS